ncbi:GNAT family protein [Sulfurimonas sp.]|uniref:GNAT family N-acetyltransferase n=1 Tax=Sulfurimonas sp. TaxID=2022749 RepID=UPI002AAFE238|nr:GNAT family protein [Sulfurimonas sp.]
MKLEGKNIYLRPIEFNDSNGNYPHWFNDPIVCKYNSHGDYLYTKQMAIDYIKMIEASNIDEVYAICDKKTNNHIGNIALHNISQKNRCAEFAILIGEISFMGQGIGKEAVEIIIDYAFNILKFHRVYCGVSQHNVAMQKLVLNLRMKQEGVLVDAMIKNDQYADIYLYAIINN